jgi:hypothetical protein
MSADWKQVFPEAKNLPVLRNTDVHYRDRKSLPSAANMSQLNEDFISVRSSLILSSHLHLSVSEALCFMNKSI